MPITTLARTRPWLVGAAVACASQPAVQAQNFEHGPFHGRIDTTISAGALWRVESRDLDFVGIANGGNRASVNGDDGNLNYDNDLRADSIVLKVTTDFDIRYKDDMGIFARGTYFIDFENNNRNFFDDADYSGPFGDPADQRRRNRNIQREVGENARLLDFFGYWNLAIGDHTLNMRLGKQVISWGESTFIPNGVNIINPIRVSALRTPGAELREALIPVPIAWAGFDLTEDISVEAWYQLKWENTEPDATGAYFSTNDFVGAGGELVMLGFGSAGENTPGATTTRIADRQPSDDEQGGLAVRFAIPDWNYTEISLYGANYHSRLPVTSAIAAGGSVGPTGNYFIEYPENIRIFGIGFSGELLETGIAVQGEYSYKQDVPLQVDDVEVLLEALGFANQIPGFVGGGNYVQGFRRFDVQQAQMTFTKLIGGSNWFGANQMVLLGEVGWQRTNGFPTQEELRFEGPGTPAGGFPAGGPVNNPFQQPSDTFATASSWGYRLLTRWEYNNVFAGVNLLPRVVFAHDVNGVTPSPGALFVEDRKATQLAVEATYLSRYSFGISYTRFFGGGTQNLLQDRDFVSANFKYSF